MTADTHRDGAKRGFLAGHRLHHRLRQRQRGGFASAASALETATRFTLTSPLKPVIHKQSLYPVCIDVSHPAGQRDLRRLLAKAAVGRRSRLLMIEVPQPARMTARDVGPVPRTGCRAARAGCLFQVRRSCKTLRPPSQRPPPVEGRFVLAGSVIPARCAGP